MNVRERLGAAVPTDSRPRMARVAGGGGGVLPTPQRLTPNPYDGTGRGIRTPTPFGRGF